MLQHLFAFIRFRLQQELIDDDGQVFLLPQLTSAACKVEATWVGMSWRLASLARIPDRGRKVL